MRDLSEARSFLFVPGDRPERFEKAEASGADVVVLDLEDAVLPEARDRARQAVRAWLQDHPGALVRISARAEPDHAKDLASLAGTGAAVMLAKTESAEEASSTSSALDGARVVALIETPAGVVGAHAIASADCVDRLAFGSIDLATRLGVDHRSRDALLLARTTLVLISAVAGIAAPVDGVTTDYRDLEVVAGDARLAAGLGFTATLCIHPAQVAAVHAAYRPSVEEAEQARRVLEAGSGSGAVGVGGIMVDPPVLQRARQVLARFE